MEDIKYEFNSRDYPELWRVLDELEMICLEEALKDPLRRTKITLRGFDDPCVRAYRSVCQNYLERIKPLKNRVSWCKIEKAPDRLLPGQI